MQIVNASGKIIPGVEDIYQDHLYLGESKRSVLRLKLTGELSAEHWAALLGGEITVGEGGGAEVHEGYNAVQENVVVLIRTDEVERTVTALSDRLAAVQAEAGETLATLASAQETQAILTRVLAPKLTDAEVLEMDVWPGWQPDTAYQMGEVVGHGGMLYRVAQGHTSQAHQMPGGEGALALYKPVQTGAAAGEALPWVSGEEIVLGDRRRYEDVVYECIAPDGAGANVHSPNIVPAVWKAVA